MQLFEVDVLDAAPFPVVSGPALVVVRAGGEVLGQVHLRWYDPLAEEATRRDLLDRYSLPIAVAGRLRLAEEPVRPAASAVSVVVVTAGDARSLAACLRSLAGASEGGAPVVGAPEGGAPEVGGSEVVVVGVGDDATTAPARAVAEAAGAGWTTSTTAVAAKDAGWRAATGEVVAFVDDRARPPTGFTEAVAGAFLAPGIGVMIGPVLAAELVSPAQRALDARQSRARSFQRLLLDPASPTLGLSSLWVQAGVNLAVRKAVLESAGGFDGRVAASASTWPADIAFVRWAVDGGVGAVHEPNAFIRRVGAPDWRSALGDAREHGRGFRLGDGPAAARHALRRAVDAVLAVRAGEAGVGGLLAAEALGSWRARR